MGSEGVTDGGIMTVLGKLIVSLGLLWLCSGSFVSARNIGVASFKYDESDITAIGEQTLRLDPNGNKSALIKVKTTQKGFLFDVGMLGIVDVEQQNADHPAEIWVYVPAGALKISIQHPLLGSIDDYVFPERLKSGKTYVMELTADQVNTLVVDYENSQTLDISVYPPDAELFINGMKQTLDRNGRSSTPMAFGNYTYRATAPRHHPGEGEFQINDKYQSQRLDIRLKPAYGFLDIVGGDEVGGAAVFIDDEKVGTAPLYDLPVESGRHQVAVYQNLYASFVSTVTITDSATFVLRPELIPDNAPYEIIIDGDAEAQIFDNGSLLGIGRWEGLLGSGKHVIEARKENHYPSRLTVNVEKDIPRKVSLSRPEPVCGAVEIKSVPAGAKVYIDGNKKEAGVTDFYVRNLIVGPHHATIELKGYRPEEFDFTVEEGQTTHIEKTLTNYYDGIISSVPRADIWINGVPEGRTPFSFNCNAGTYLVELRAGGYIDFSKKIKFDGTTGDLEIKLQRNFTKPNEFYIQAGVSTPGLTTMVFGLGFYIQNFNVEGNYLLGLSESESIYWNDKSGVSGPFVAKYKPSGGDVKIGYGIRLHSRLRLTPQVGCRFLTLAEKAEAFSFPGVNASYNSYWGAVSNAKSASMLFGLRLNVALVRCLSISLTPQYLLKVAGSPGFDAISEISTKVKSFAQGFTMAACLNLFF